MTEQPRAKSYISRVFDSALVETKKYWTAPRITASIAPPIIGAVLWVIYKPWPGWEAVVQVAIVSILGFLALWGIVFIVNLVISPARLDQQNRSEIEELKVARARSHPADEAKIAHVRSLLSEFSEGELGLVKWLLHTGETDRAKLAASKCPDAAISGAIEKGLKNQLIRGRTDRIGAQYVNLVSVNPNHAEALRDLLFATLGKLPDEQDSSS
jgi:hypothetical protein